MRPLPVLIGALAVWSAPGMAQDSEGSSMSAAAKAALSHIDTNSVAEETPMRNRDPRSQAEERITARRLAREGTVSVPGSAKARQALAYRKALDD